MFLNYVTRASAWKAMDKKITVAQENTQANLTIILHLYLFVCKILHKKALAERQVSCPHV